MIPRAELFAINVVPFPILVLAAESRSFRFAILEGLQTEPENQRPHNQTPSFMEFDQQQAATSKNVGVPVPIAIQGFQIPTIAPAIASIKSPTTQVLFA